MHSERRGVVMIEAINRQPSGLVEMQNSRQRLSVAGDFAEAFRGAAKEVQSAGQLPDASPTISTPKTAVVLPQIVDTPAPAVTPTATQPAGSDQFPVQTPIPAGWSGSPDQAGSSYNPVDAWGQVPGQQPSWITGNYPGADWTAVNEAGFLMPYSSLSPGPGEDVYSGANQNVIDQDWAKYYTQVDGAQAGNQMVWGANNPTHAVPAPWMAGSSATAQFTPFNPGNPAQPTQPNYVPPSQMPA